MLELYTDEKIIQCMLDVESALAQAQSELGIIPSDAAELISKKCKVEHFDLGRIKSEAALGANLCIPLVKQLTGLVNSSDNKASAYVHFGITSQDIIDTATMIQVRESLTLIINELHSLMHSLASLSDRHRLTCMVGRTFMQHAKPISFGFKVSGWLDPLIRSKKSIESVSNEALVVQLGGASGMLSNVPGSADKLIHLFAEKLGLNSPDRSWHSNRDRVASIASTLAILSGNISKMITDMSLMMQTEVAELSESGGAGNGGSSAMPHKKNPVSVISISANTSRIPGLLSTVISAMAQEHERSVGLWHAEWETLTEIIQLTYGAINKSAALVKNLKVNTAQMLKNLELSHGLIYAENLAQMLAASIGKTEAFELMESCCNEATAKSTHLREICFANKLISKYLSVEQIDQCFDPMASIGNAQVFIDQVLKKVF